MSQQTIVSAAKRLPQFTKSALIAWSKDDAFFPLEDGRRLAAALPNSQLEVIGQARKFSMIDRPEQLADLIVGVAHASAIRRAASRKDVPTR
jgi:pimeloyl-ACP methyl ester carboxylesterase